MMRKLETIYLQGNNVVYNQDHLEPGLVFEVNATLNHTQEKIEFHGLHTFDDIDINIKSAYIIEIDLPGNIIDRQKLESTDILQRFLIKNINLL
jgi:hypothetical protein